MKRVHAQPVEGLAAVVVADVEVAAAAVVAAVVMVAVVAAAVEVVVVTAAVAAAVDTGIGTRVQKGGCESGRPFRLTKNRGQGTGNPLLRPNRL